MSILAPSVVKLSHALFEHQDVHCYEIGPLHIHKVELDCDFQKFSLSPQQYPIYFQTQNFIVPAVKVDAIGHYSFLSNYQKLHFALRGPPLVS
ncbi:FIG00652378: hypothetical protein [hydrothermal vent metagenome]|uniref:Uncharacterized protein n=1 Tax=hydrothermal vent metagenome TaxID=652676 RepID=A0A3B0TM67_9ZZZZ